MTFALFSRYMRSSMLDNITEDYVRTARAKGASERRVLIRHVLRNSLIPIATLVGLNLPADRGRRAHHRAGVQLPGYGVPVLPGRAATDYPILLGVLIVVAIATVVGSLLADIAYAVLDPRVRYVSS